MERVILPCDLNNFYASAACRGFHHLKGKTVAVCGWQEEKHGVVLEKMNWQSNMGAARENLF